MSQKIGLILCGNSGVDYENIDYPVKVFRSTLNLGGKEYEDFVDISASEFYNTVVNNPDIDVSTAQTSTGKMAEIYQSLKDEGYDSALVITISSKLSGTFQGAVLAQEMVEDFPVRVVDSRSVSYGEVFLAKEAIRLINEGKSIDEIGSALDEMREKITIYVLVDTLKYLVKNGRLSGVQGMLGSLLKIKPLLRLKSDGALLPYEKIRTKSKARSRLLEVIKEDIKDKKVSMFIVYTNNKDEAVMVKKDLLEQDNDLDIEIVPLTPVVGAHAGPGTLGVGYIVLDWGQTLDKSWEILNELRVVVFNHILSTEAKHIRKKGVTLSMTEVHVLEAIRNAEVPIMSHVAKQVRVMVGTLTTSINILVKKICY